MRIKLKYFVVTAIAIVSMLTLFGTIQIPLSASTSVLREKSQIVAQSGNSQGDSENKIIFGYIADAPPVSSQQGAFISGYCGDLKEYLKDKGWQLDPVAMQYSERFNAFETLRDSVIQGKQPAIECGPNTKTIPREDNLNKITNEKGVTSKFSNTFFTSSTKLLINKSKLRELSENPENLRIGVLGSTTTQVIGQIYPTSTIVSVGSRSDAITQLERGGQSGGVDAYASDEILLIGIKSDENFRRGEEFAIEPKLYGFTREEYGIVTYNSDYLRDKINDWINKDGQNSRNRLEDQVGMSSALGWFVASVYFYPILFGILAAFLLLLVSHPLFVFLFLKLIPAKLVNRFLYWLKARKKKKGENDLVVVLINRLLNDEVFTVVAHKANDKFNIGFIDGDAAIKLVEELGIQPLLQRYREDGLPQAQAEEKVAEVIAQKADDDPQIYKMLQTWLDAAGKTAATEIATKVIERVLGQNSN